VILGSASRNAAGLTTTIQGGSVRQSWTYDHLGRIIDIKGSSSPSQTVRVNEAWSYYGMNDPETLSTFRGGLPQRTFTFSYDDRHQLTYADDDTGGYTGQFELRPSGRLDRAFIASVGAPMAPPRDVDYVYATAADRDPEAIQRLSSNVGAAPILYTSDESGNIASRDEDGSGGLPSFKFIYDGDDQQRRVTAPSLENELYYYDHTGQRVLAVTRLQNGTITRTRFWHGSLEVEYPQSGPVETTVHLSLGANPVARVANRVTARRVIHNHLGHFLAAFTRSGLAIGRGKPRTIPESTPRMISPR
jgi:YD repeat-containing protein